jgi:hypothetical protein
VSGRARRIAAVATVCLALGLGIYLALDESSNQELGQRTSMASIGAELFYLDATPIVRRGSTRALVLRFERPTEFVPYHFRRDGLEAPKTIEEWAAHLKAPVVFNAGQFGENLEYLGWLKRDGEWLSPAKKPLWKGLLVSGPLDGAVWGRIVDLDHADPTEVVERYRHVIQSMMLLDAEHKIRVRDTDLTACRSVVAEDQRGRIMLIITEGATTLADLARWLPQTPLGVVRAMNLDGGIESQLAIATPELSLVVYGQHGTGGTAFSPGPGQIRYPLPAVVAIRTSTVSAL